ncbi:MAG: hypothetical protein AAGA56_27900, partial [Myxococcota bacterium]
VGAVAMACHGYVRATRDIDLATELATFTQMRTLYNRCRDRGWSAELRLPDAEDPLGGVLDVEGDGFDLIQVVNFYNPLRPTPNPGTDALDRAVALDTMPALRVATVEDLILLKLYAGGRKSELDVIELIEATPSLQRSSLLDRARRFELEEVLSRLLRP